MKTSGLSHNNVQVMDYLWRIINIIIWQLFTIEEDPGLVVNTNVVVDIQHFTPV